MTVETHPHALFIPPRAEILILGSFPGKHHVLAGEDEWYYSAPRNQFWKIISAVYDREPETIEQKKALFAEKRIAIGDLFLKVRRSLNNNSDSNLQIVEYNTPALQKALKENNFKQIFFTGQMVGREFKKLFPEIQLGKALPSPSPRYATMSLQNKIEKYKEALLSFPGPVS